MRIPIVSARPENWHLPCNIVYRYVGSPNNPFIGVISGPQGLVESSPIIPQTDVALSPRLIEILQHREPTHKRTRSDTAPRNDDRWTAVNNLPEKAASTTGYQITRHAADGIMQRLGAAEQNRNGLPIPSPARSETPDALEIDAFWSTSPTILHRESLSRVSEPGESTLNPPESPVSIPKISIQGDDSAPSDGSSFTVVDSSEYQPPVRADSTGISRRGRGARIIRGVDDARNDQGASSSRTSRGDSSMRKASDASPVKTGPQYGPPGQRTNADDHRLSALLSTGAALSLLPIEQTTSRSSSMRRKSTTLTYNHVSWLTWPRNI